MRIVKIAMVAVLMVFSIGCQERERNSQTERSEISTIEGKNAVANQREDSTGGVKISNNETEASGEFSEEETSVQPVSSSPPVSQTLNREEINTPPINEPSEDRNHFLKPNNLALLGSLSLNLILFLLLRKTLNGLKKKKKETAELKRGKEYYKLNHKQVLQNLESLKTENENRFKNRPIEIKKKEVKTNNVKEPYDNERPIEYLFDNIDTQPSKSIPAETPKVILYAGKPLDANTLSAVSSQQDEHRSIFKLILEDKNANIARFEVIQNEYILKMAANSPDTYLYHVCKPENSNQNFDGRILTTEKGTARLLDGKWKVNDEDKATIKFQ